MQNIVLRGIKIIQAKKFKSNSGGIALSDIFDGLLVFWIDIWQLIALSQNPYVQTLSS